MLLPECLRGVSHVYCSFIRAARVIMFFSNFSLKCPSCYTFFPMSGVSGATCWIWKERGRYPEGGDRSVCSHNEELLCTDPKVFPGTCTCLLFYKMCNGPLNSNGQLRPCNKMRQTHALFSSWERADFLLFCYARLARVIDIWLTIKQDVRCRFMTYWDNVGNYNWHTRLDNWIKVWKKRKRNQKTKRSSN